MFWEGPWKGGADDLEPATLGWVDWFNHTRLHSALDYRPPAEAETEYDGHFAFANRSHSEMAR